jgi:UDP-N-acetylenolpyruvoylglucosamine reductase
VTIEERVPLSRFTTLGTGGPARWFARPETAEDLARTSERLMFG